MNGFKLKIIVGVVIIFFSFTNFESCHYSKKKMEITTVIKEKRITNDFVSKNFEHVSSSYHNPIFPCKVNYKKKTSVTTSFCNFPVVECWMLKKDSLYTFFLLIKNDSQLVKGISKIYGEHLMESEVEMNDNYMYSTSYYWEIGRVNIVLNNFRNVYRVPNFDDCVLVSIGNMKYSEIITVSN